MNGLGKTIYQLRGSVSMGPLLPMRSDVYATLGTESPIIHHAILHVWDFLVDVVSDIPRGMNEVPILRRDFVPEDGNTPCDRVFPNAVLRVRLRAEVVAEAPRREGYGHRIILNENWHRVIQDCLIVQCLPAQLDS